jgi:hypothetical protein
MTDDESTVDEATETETDGDRPLAGAAAQSALKKERKARQEAEKRERALADRLKKIEDAQLSETERFRQEAEDAARRLEELEQRVERDRTERMRSDVVRRAAKDFADPEDAIAILATRGELDSIEDEKEAVAALKVLAKEKPHLLKQPESAPSGLEQVLKNGKPLQEQADESLRKGLDIIPGEELVAMSETDLAALKRLNPKLYYASVDALGRNETEFAVAR